MCGILAIFSQTSGSENIRKRALDASKLLRHRGPDWSGLACYDHCVLAHERLAIVGLHTGSQPIINRSATAALSVNGEIYNYKEIEESLKALHPGTEAEFQSASDCEILLNLYQFKGPHFLTNTKILGMYAFAIYDVERHSITVGRDPSGIIPLYMGWDKDGSIWFASELKALQHDCDHIEIFPPGHYFHHQITPPTTTVSNGGSVEEAQHPGIMKRFCDDRWYVDVDYLPTTPLDLGKLENSFTMAVRSHLLSEVPFGLLLSGGLDSSLVASVACREYKKMGNLDKLRSFCIGLEDSPDIAASEKVAQFIGTRHYSFTFTIQEGLDAISDCIYFLETFDVTSIRSGVPMMLLARRVKATGCKMVLSGEGSDEAMAGYLYFHKAPNSSELHRETVRKIKKLHQFDCLRANKAMMAWGVETRVPFLDRDFLNYIMNIDPAFKMCGGTVKKIEKHALRAAFDNAEDPYLPSEVLWRQKEQFSDGVGYGWIDALIRNAGELITDNQMKFAGNRFPKSPPVTKEAYLYREIFSKHFPHPSAADTVPYGKSVACSTPEIMSWDPTFANDDPSGRAIAGVHVNSFEGA